MSDIQLVLTVGACSVTAVLEISAAHHGSMRCGKMGWTFLSKTRWWYGIIHEELMFPSWP